MKIRPALLAAVATSVLVCTVVLLTSMPDLDARTVEPRPTSIAAPMESTDPAPSVNADPIDTSEDADPGRASLASVPIPAGSEEDPAVVRGRVGVEILRWPDGAPLGEVTSEIFGSPGLPIREYLTARDGFASLAIDEDQLPLDLHILVEGFERGTAHVSATAPHATVALRPLNGWYGRVLSVTGEPVEGVQVSGWWIETARPFGDNSLSIRKAREEKELEPLEPGQLPSDFVSAQGERLATTLTDEEGHYYVEPLEADVRGEMTLLVAHHPDASSDVLREALPRIEPRLPDIVLHRPQRLQGLVVSRSGNPISEAVVIARLARGWSHDLVELRTDEAGRFVLDRPVEPIVLSVEKTGYALAGNGTRQMESADGMWRSLAAMGKQYGGPAYLFSQAYGQWADTLLPRSRESVTVSPLQSDIRLEMFRRPRFPVYVFDPGAGPFDDPGISDALVTITYGGLDAGKATHTTRPDGIAKALSVDLAWQPMIVRVQADGFLPRQSIVPLGTTDLQFGLVRVDEADDGSSPGKNPEKEGLLGQVTGLEPGETAQLVVYHTARSDQPHRILWSGETRPGGRFNIEDWLTLSKLNRYLFAFIDAAPGEHPSSRRAGVIGPLPPFMARTVTLPLEAAAPMTLHLGQFDSDTPHRIQVRYSPFVGASTAMAESVDLTHAPSWSSAHTIHAPYGWTVRAFVERQLEDNVPIVDFLRRDRRQPNYKSLATTWTDWVAASDTALLRFAYPDAHLFVRAPGMISLSGSIDGLPPSPPRLRVAALGKKAHWLSEVSPSGWFNFPELPAGSFRLLLYSPPDNGEGFDLTDEGAILGSKKVNCSYSRNDVLLPWAKD